MAVQRAREVPKHTPFYPPDPREVPLSTRGRPAAPAQHLVYKTGSLRPALRAIPFPEVTELFCRLPSATLLYRLEAANLGDLMRLWVRTRVRINDSRGFSWTVATTPDPPRRGGLFLVVNPLSRQADFRVRQPVKQKRKHFPEIAPASPRAFVLPLIIHASMMEY